MKEPNKYEIMIVTAIQKDINTIIRDTIWKVSFDKALDNKWYMFVHRTNKGQISITTFAAKNTLNPKAILEYSDIDLVKIRQNIIADVLNPSQPWHKESTK